jgi:hypothetical protein
LIGTVARTAVIAGTATAVSGGVQRRQAERAEQQQVAAQQQAAPAPAPAPVAAEPEAAESSMIDQLKELAALKDQGILTDEEFAAQKAKVLAAG